MDKKVIVIEDESVCRKLLTSRLSDAGFQVFAPECESMNGAYDSIIETIDENDIKFIVADLMLPGQDGSLSPSNGVKLIAEIRRKVRNTAVYVLTGSVNDEVFAPLKKLGVRGSYVKEESESIANIIADMKSLSGG